MKNYHYRRLSALILFALIIIPTTFAQITSVTPNAAAQGQTIDIFVTAENVNFLQGSNSLWLNQNTQYYTGENITAVDTNILKATYSFNSNQPTGYYTVYINNSGNTYSLTNGFLLNPYTQTPVLDSISPKSAKQAELFTIRLYGTHTHFNKIGASNSVWLKNASFQVNATNVSVVDSVTLDAQFNIGYFYPTGMYSASIQNIYDGTLTKTNAFELLQGDNTPAITAISPDSAEQGQTLDIEITCENTNFVQGSNIVSLSQNTTTIYPNYTNVISNTKLLANYTFTTGHVPGIYDLRIMDYNTYNITKAGAFELVAGANIPAVVSVSPSSASQGQTLDIEITCENTSFTQGSNTLNLKQNSTTINPNSITVLSNTKLRANFSFTGAHPVGNYTLNIVNFNTSLSKSNAFELLQGNTLPKIVSVNPDTATIGQTLDIDVTCRNIIFYQGTNTITLKQNNTTVYPTGTSVIINDTVLRAKFTFNSGLPSGKYSANVYANGTTLTKANAFVVLSDGLPRILTLSPSTGMQEQTLNIDITCENTNFYQGSNVINVNLKQDTTTIIPNSITPISATKLRTNFTFTTNHPLGNYTLNVSGGSLNLSKTNAFQLFVNTLPKIISISPTSAFKGQTLDIEVTAENIYFYQGSNTVYLKQNSTYIYANYTKVLSTTKVKGNFTFTSNNPGGNYDVYVSGTGIASKTNAFELLSTSISIDSISPTKAKWGENVSIFIYAKNSHFTESGITNSVKLKKSSAEINTLSVTVINATTLEAQFVLTSAPTTGFYDIVVENSYDGPATLSGAFEVQAIQGQPAIVSVTPEWIIPWETTDVSITGENVNFTQGTNVIMLRDKNNYIVIYPNSIVVNSATSLTASFTITEIPLDGWYDLYVNNISTGINLVKEDAIAMNVVIDVAEKPKEKLNLFPNPVSNLLNISGAFEKAQIFDLNGRLLIDSKDKEIDVSKLKNSVYIVKIKNYDGTIITRKVFKQ